MLMLAFAGKLITLEAEQSCEETSNFSKESFALAYFPPDHSGYSMAILVGTFPQDTLVSEVIIKYSLDNKHEKTYSTNINITYFQNQLVQLAPWFNLKKAKKGNYDATFTITSHNQDIYCLPFTFKLD